MQTSGEGYSTSKLILLGVSAGLVAGFILAVAEMALGVVTMDSFFRSLRLTASIVLGTEVLDARYSLVVAGAVGLLTHIVLSTLYSLIFVFWLAAKGKLDSASGVLLIYGWLFGLGLWLINYLVIAPIAFTQFMAIDQFWQGFIPHSFGYGAVLGGYVATGLPQRSIIEAVMEEALRT